MKAIVIAALLALSFTTGFTCSKNQPEQAPVETNEMAPSDAAPVEGTVPDATAAPTEAAPAEATH